MGNVYSGSDPKNKLRVREVDGAPSVFPVNTIVVSNGTLTDDGGGQVTVTTGGGGGGGSGTVTSVDTGTGLQGGPVTTTGTIELTDTAVTPGVYTNAVISVNQKGRIFAASNGLAGATLTGSTNNTISTVTGANALQGESNLTFDGTLLTVTGNLSVGVDATSTLGFMGTTAVVQQSAALPSINPVDTSGLVSLGASADANFNEIQGSIDSIVQALQAYGLLQ